MQINIFKSIKFVIIQCSIVYFFAHLYFFGVRCGNFAIMNTVEKLTEWCVGKFILKGRTTYYTPWAGLLVYTCTGRGNLQWYTYGIPWGQFLGWTFPKALVSRLFFGYIKAVVIRMARVYPSNRPSVSLRCILVGQPYLYHVRYPIPEYHLLVLGYP